MSASDEKFPLVERREQDGIEIDRPHAVVGLLEADPLMDERVGDVEQMLLEFILTEIGPSIYNRGVADALLYLYDLVAEANGACYESEFTYWTRSGGKPRK